MAFKVIYAAEIYDDLQQAVDFYNSRKKGLGVRFFKNVKSQVSQIKSNAYGFQVRYFDIRCASLKRFPYTVHYRVVSFVCITTKLLYIFWIEEHNSVQSRYPLMELA